ncbi:MAG: hypothetical protein FJ344_02910 [Sphingomonadales bacterium]|nr:hypothetical protein [Sphingomonadales bacterium]
MAVSILGAIVFPLYHMVTDFSKAKGALMGVLGIGLLFGISFVLSDNEVMASYEKFNITPVLSQFIGSSLVMNYILGVGVIVIALLGEVYNAFK